jgi:hypothetical protein
LTFAVGALSVIAATILYALHMVAAYTALLGISLMIVAAVLFVLGVVLRQGNMIQRELWVVQRFQIALQKNQPATRVSDEIAEGGQRRTRVARTAIRAARSGMGGV